MSGLCAGYELKKAGFKVTILEASSRVGGRVKTFRDPVFAPGLHGEGGAMRIPKNHFLLHQYIKDFGLEPELFPFEMENKFIYVSGFGEKLTYTKFNSLLKDGGCSTESKKLLSLFPGLKESEKGYTCDELFASAITDVVNAFWDAYRSTKCQKLNSKAEKIRHAYQEITAEYDRYSLRSFLIERARWSLDAINLYDLGSPNVVFEIGFIECLKGAFLEQGKQAGMEQLQSGMDAVPNAFISPDRGGGKYLLLTFACPRN